MLAAQQEKELVAGKAANEGGKDNPRQRQVTPMGCKASQHQDGLALEQCTNQYGPIAIRVDERFKSQCNCAPLDRGVLININREPNQFRAAGIPLEVSGLNAALLIAKLIKTAVEARKLEAITQFLMVCTARIVLL
jgi:hypothetical protein